MPITPTQPAVRATTRLHVVYDVRHTAAGPHRCAACGQAPDILARCGCS